MERERGGTGGGKQGFEKKGKGREMKAVKSPQKVTRPVIDSHSEMQGDRRPWGGFMRERGTKLERTLTSSFSGFPLFSSLAFGGFLPGRRGKVSVL